MPQPKDYKHIRAWGRMMHSFEYYIRNQQEEAAADDAPIDAIYKRNQGWFTFAEVTNQGTRKEIEMYLEDMK